MEKGKTSEQVKNYFSKWLENEMILFSLVYSDKSPGSLPESLGSTEVKDQASPQEEP